MLVISNS
uniref:Uncharacterized protein n=1 Tax=Oryza nivara TaxID=4536 RepID=A0A1Y8Z4S6_ORYNI